MRGHTRGFPERTALLALAGAVLAASLPVAAAAAAPIDVAGLPPCDGLPRTTERDDEVASPWQVVLDEDGVVQEHRLTLRRGGREAVVRAGSRGFAIRVGDGRLLIGDRAEDGTRLTMIEIRRSCRLWTRSFDGLVYPHRDALAGEPVRLATHEPRSRRFTGTLLLDVETGASNGLIDGQCIETCLPHDGDISAAALQPAGAPRPVPNFSRGGWPKDTTLPFRWKSGAAPPSWATTPLLSAANDARRTSGARSPRFVYRSSASNAVAYGGNVPGYCGINGIACAGRSIPSFWGVWLRPYGTDYAWGSLRWCQKTSSAQGCFDIRRVLLHELGHIIGLTHPSSAGFTLAGGESVMQAITPTRPKPGAGRHAFGRCDVATLQELYDTPDNKTPISSCNDVATILRLDATRSSLAAGESVTLRARLEIDDRSAYRQLRGNPLNGRSVKLRYRRAGSNDVWKTAWMKSTYSSGNYELTIAPAATWEFKAVFPAPADEGLRYSRSATVKVKVAG